jgi:hypothetical protein
VEGPDHPTVGFSLPDALAGLSARYDIDGELGRGGMGIVYRARDRQTGDVVALKILHPAIAVDATRIEQFKNELLLSRRITHKNVCRVHDLNVFDGTVVISMELVEGDSLRHLLNRVGSVSIRHGSAIIRQVIAGLAEAHAQGVVHRDLKPENILIAVDGSVKVMDFGIARSANAAETTTGMIIGTPAYMSPEQASGGHGDARSDIYALGVVMYEMFAGQAPFSAETPVAMVAKQVHETPVPPRERDPDLPVRIERVILKCLHKDPAKRYQSMGELEAALDQQGAEPATQGSHTATLPLHITQWRRTDSILALAAVVGVTVFFFGFSRTSLAPLSEVTFDRGALRRMAQEYSQRLGAPASPETAIGVSTYAWKYMSLARQAGAPAARQLANNPVPYWAWVINLTGTGFEFNNRGELLQFARNLPADSLGPIAMPEAQATAERVLQEVFKRAATELEVKRAETDGRVAKFRWRERVARSLGVAVEYSVTVTNQGIWGAFTDYVVPADDAGGETLTTQNWGVPVWCVLALIIAALGLFRARTVDLMTRWRVIASLFSLFAGLGLGVFYVADGFRATSVMVLVSVSIGLTTAAVWLFGSVACERIVRRSDAWRLASFASLFGLKALPPACGLAVVRGTLIGLCILGVDAIGVWAATTFLGARLGEDSILFFLGPLLSGARWPLVVLLVFASLEAFAIGLLVAFFGAVGERISTRGWACVFAPALLLALGDVHFSMAAIQPYYWTMTLLFVDYVLLFFAFSRFDLLTVVTALFTFAFCSANYSMVVMFRQIGPVEEWAAFVVWGLCVAGAATVAFQKRLRTAFGRMSAAVE